MVSYGWEGRAEGAELYVVLFIFLKKDLKQI